jgi:hypothetical protein
MQKTTNSVTAKRLPIARRNFLAMAASVVACSAAKALGKPTLGKSDDLLGPLKDEVGITTSSFSRHLVARPGDKQFSLIDLPRIMRDELDMRVIDLNTTSLGETNPAWLDKVRHAVDKAGCVMINLKMNQKGLDMNSPDRDIRNKALTVYKRSIDAASHLGIPYARPLPLKPTPDMKIHVDSYRQLADFGAARNVRMLVENYAWMESDPQSVVKLIAAIDRDVAACPDTGNWADNETRYAGLAASFPQAVTCDFKAKALSKTGEHPQYDLRRCFDIGTAAGFRGPWCLEHANADRDVLLRELAMIRDMLRGWIKDAASR